MKLYVSSGKFRAVIDRPDPDTAAIDAIKRAIDKGEQVLLGEWLWISERGYENIGDSFRFHPTEPFLRRTGLIDLFRNLSTQGKV